MTPTPASHADHDPLAIAAYAVGDATGSELDAAMALVAACPECALLHHDLRSIAAAMPALPAPVRNRDFRLTPGQAASLRPAGWRRILAPLAGPRFAFAGPLGTGLATLGLAGFLIAGAAGMPLAGSAAAPQANPESTDNVAALQAPSDAPAAASEAPAASLPIETAPGGGEPVGAGYGQAGNGGEGGEGGEGGVVVGAAANAASPGTDGGVTRNGTGAGAGGPMGPTSVDPKATDLGDRRGSTTPDESLVFMTAMDAPVETAPVTTPLVVLALVMLVAGVLLGGLRLIARRAV